MMQVFVNGLSQGLVLALLAVAFQLVYLPTRIFFVAMAAVASLAPYVFAWMQHLSVPIWAALILVLVLSGTLSMAMERLNHRPLDARGASAGAHLVSSLAIYLVVVQCIAIWQGGETRTLLSDPDPITWKWPGMMVMTRGQVVSMACVITTLCVVALLLYRTALGLKLRALSANPVEFMLRGNDVHAFRMLAFFVSGVLASGSAILVGLESGYEPHAGLKWTLLAVVAVILGGRSLLIGPIVGGILLGLVREQVTWSFSASLQDAASFALLALVLVLRPRGLLARDQRVDALTA